MMLIDYLLIFSSCFVQTRLIILRRIITLSIDVNLIHATV